MSSDIFKKVFSGSVHQYVSSFFMVVFGALTSVYIIRNLSVEDFGTYHFLGSIIMLAQITTSLGLLQTVNRYLPEYRKKEDSYLQKKIVLVSMLIRLAAGIVFVLCIIIAKNWIIHFFNLPSVSSNFFPLIALIILFVLESQLLGDGVLLALFENEYRNFSKISYNAFKFFLFYFSLRMGYGITGIIWCWLIIEFMLFVLFLSKTYRKIFSLAIKDKEIKKFPLKRFVKFGGPLFLSQGSYFLRDKTADVFILSYFLGVRSVGLYSFAFGIPLMLMSFSPGSQLRAVLTPFLVNRHTSADNLNELSYFFELINKMIFFSMVPVFSVLMILADKIILYIFNPQYLQVVNMFVISLGFVMVQQFMHAYIPILYTLEKTKIIFIGSFTAVYNLIMDLILIPSLGIWGAIIATGTAGILLLVYYGFALKKERIIEFHYPWRSFLKFSINTGILSVMVFLLKFSVNNVFSLIFVLVFAVAFYLLLSYFNKGFDEEDRELLNSVIGRNIFVF